MYSYSVQYSLKNRRRNKEDARINAFVSGRDQLQHQKCQKKKKRRKMDMSITVTGAKRDKDKDSGGWHKWGVAGYIAQSMCQ